MYTFTINECIHMQIHIYIFTHTTQSHNHLSNTFRRTRPWIMKCTGVFQEGKNSKMLSYTLVMAKILPVLRLGNSPWFQNTNPFPGHSNVLIILKADIFSLVRIYDLCGNSAGQNFQYSTPVRHYKYVSHILVRLLYIITILGPEDPSSFSNVQQKDNSRLAFLRLVFQIAHPKSRYLLETSL